MGINEDGFLSEDIERWRQEKRMWFGRQFRVAYEISRLGQRFLPLSIEGESVHGDFTEDDRCTELNVVCQRAESMGLFFQPAHRARTPRIRCAICSPYFLAWASGLGASLPPAVSAWFPLRTFTLIDCGCGSGTFDIEIVTTPFLNSASTLSSFRLSGKRIERAKVP